MEIFEGLEKDLVSKYKNKKIKFYLSKIILKYQKQYNFKLMHQILLLTIIRKVFQEWLTESEYTQTQDFHKYLLWLNEIIDQTQIALSTNWENIYSRKHSNDQLVIKDLKTVKDDLQLHLNIIAIEPKIEYRPDPLQYLLILLLCIFDFFGQKGMVLTASW